MGTHSLLRRDVVDVRAGDAQPAGGGTAADGAGAGDGNGSEVCCIGGVAEVEGSGGGYGVAEALEGKFRMIS